jgi:hypothetical protein
MVVMYCHLSILLGHLLPLLQFNNLAKYFYIFLRTCLQCPSTLRLPDFYI